MTGHSIALANAICSATGSSQAGDLEIEPSTIAQSVIAATPGAAISIEALALWRWTDDTVLGFGGGAGLYTPR